MDIMNITVNQLPVTKTITSIITAYSFPYRTIIQINDEIIHIQLVFTNLISNLLDLSHFLSSVNILQPVFIHYTSLTLQLIQ
jgi:hypothetical protein